MSAPTARLDRPTTQYEEADSGVDDDEPVLDADVTVEPLESATSSLTINEEGIPRFPSLKEKTQTVKLQMQSVQVPPHRFSPLRACWTKIYAPLVEHLKLQVKMDVRNKKVMLRSCRQTKEPGALQKGVDFVRAFTLGFDVEDALALIRLDDLYIETFEIKDVKTLTGDHLSRAIGRIAGKDGKTKYAIENASRTRVVLADSKIHILGGFTNIRIARETIVSLILGSPPGKIYGNLRTISSRMKERY